MPEPPMSFAGWGDPTQAIHLPPESLEMVRQVLGLRGPGAPAPALDAVRLPESRLPSATRARLEAVVGAGNVREESEVRARHARGKSTPDLLRLRAGELDHAPDAVLTPGSHDEILEVLRVCSEHGVAVVTFGGGTSVVGGVTPESTRFASVVALDVARLQRLLALDEESRTATFEPGLRGPEAEALLSQHGYTIGHHPQSFEYATLGGFAAARSSGQASAGYGRFDDLVLALTLATPIGSLTLGRAPSSAAGPDLRQLVLGSEGAFGVITSLTLQIRPVPSERAYDGWRLPSFAEGIAVVRRLAQDGPLPTVIRLSDEAETAVNLARPGDFAAPPATGGCLAITGYEGTSDDVAARRTAVSALLEQAGGEREPGAGEAWLAGRYRAPYLRDTLLDAGALVETLETATFWSGLTALYHAVSDALREALTAAGTPPLVLCHLSHVYPAGASLYFTAACAQADDPVAQWREAKRAASEAMLAAGATISHHHGIGRDHREWYAREIGEPGVAALRAVKGALDPEGVLNPGALVP